MRIVYSRRMVGPVAEGRKLLLAILAFAASDLERGDDALTDFEVLDVRANLVDDSHELYAPCHKDVLP